MATKIKYKTLLTNLKKGDTPVRRFIVLHNGTIVGDTIYAVVSEKTGIPVPMVRATDCMIWDETKDWLAKGYRVDLPGLSAFSTLPGSVDSVSAESRRASPPVPTVRLVPKKELRNCCQGQEYELENVTPGASVGIDGIIEAILQTPNVLPNGVDIEVHCTGRGLLMPDPSDPTVGAYLADSSGKVLAKAAVSESTATSLVCVFDQIDLPEGTYKFCVASRNGMDPALYGVTVGSRNVRVVNASSADEGEVQNG